MYALTLLLALAAQRPDSFSAGVREYITVDTSVLALTHVLLVDGTGAAPKTDQTIIIRAGKIAAEGPAAPVQGPAGRESPETQGAAPPSRLFRGPQPLVSFPPRGRAAPMEGNETAPCFWACATA